MGAVTVGFSIAEEDQGRLERLVRHFGGGNRSAFLRQALDVMESAERAERLRELQRYGNQRLAEMGIDPADVPEITRRALKGR
jgi:Arc/MetJ-type ribon-helix-helix transcriptional regulator